MKKTLTKNQKSVDIHLKKCYYNNVKKGRPNGQKVKKIMSNKLTKRDYFNSLLAINEVASRPELVKFIEHELELLEKKNKSRSNELTETQKENIELGKEIVEFISKKGKELTTKEIREHFGVTAQKVTPILTKLVEENSLTKRVDKRISYYKVA